MDNPPLKTLGERRERFVGVRRGAWLEGAGWEAGCLGGIITW
jgi:hypothetical protein